MSLATLQTAQTPPAPDGRRLVDFDPELIVSPDDNPAPTPAMLANLLASIREHGQLVPGFVCPSPELPSHKRLCLEGNHRLAVARLLGKPFLAFDLEREVPEEERIRLTFLHNHSRRVMTQAEMAEKAARYMELTACTAADAARFLHVSHPTLSRAFGERRIPTELRGRAETLAMSVRSLVAALPPALMGQAVDYAATPGPDDRLPTRQQVSLFIGRLKTAGKQKARKAKPVMLRVEGRTVTLTVTDADNAASVSKDLGVIVSKLAKLSDVSPEGWHFHFK